ncbi:hypothetical protein PRZ48_010171 [Zasmidium cellare]|uniref:Uncharacterized protein n=1 Tax=Zasmidium cellare TaxID=395010 RepID=A0ABR0EEM1_ZASCE|nr:hypothetical protein PRZ48_010171 [Zasmidium cellare]
MCQPFDSSDVVSADDDIQLPSRRIGQKSIEKILENAADNRLSSKKTVKQMKFGNGAAGTRIAQTLWVKRFETYREHTLKQDIKKPFSGDDLIRFFTSMIDKLDIRDQGKPVISQGMVIDAAKLLLVYGHFKWSDKDGYSITKHDARSLAMGNDRLTRGRYCSRTWLGFTRILRSSFDHYLACGVHNWDVIIAKALCDTRPVAPELATLH